MRVEGSTVALRDLRRGDADACAQAFADDPGLGTAIGVERGLTRGEVRRLVRREDRDRADGRAVRLAIVDRVDDTFLGLILLHTFRGRRAECGFFVVPAARGRGIAKEALRVLTDWAFSTLQLEHVGLRTLPTNVATQRLAEGVGFAREDGYAPFVTFGMRATAWA